MSERVEQFKKELQELVNKHQCDIVMIDIGRAYMPDYEIAVDFNDESDSVVMGQIYCD